MQFATDTRLNVGESSMASTPSSVVKRKRGTPASAPPPRKRFKNGDTPTSTIRQQTLTQAQWVTSAPSSFVDDVGMTSLEVPSRPPVRKFSKRDSTLTQMDFFHRAQVQQEEIDFGLLPVDEDEAEQPPPIPQGDAAYDSPRKPRKRKPSISIASEPATKKSYQSQGTRDYRPSSRRSNGSDVKTDSKPRRSSKRIAQRGTLLSDPAENLDFFEQALSQSPPTTKRDPHQRKLEIQDSTASNEEILSTQSQHSRKSAPPSTPQRRVDIVRSSQTPETLSPSTRKTKTIESDLRSPLRERSVNLPTAHPTTPVSQDIATAKGRRLEDEKPTASKLSKKRTTRSKPRVEDSQANLWSLPESSSPRKKQQSQPQVNTEAQEMPPPRLGGGATDSTEKLEIPSTSQVIGNSPGIEDQDSLPSVSELTGRPALPATPPELPQLAAPQGHKPNAEVFVRDFADAATSADKLQEQSEAHDEKIAEVIDDEEREGEDSESDFGSPIANDTQFNFEVEQRTSSPTRSQSRSSKSRQSLHDTQRLSDLLYAPADKEAATDTAPVPTPRLVSRSSVEAEVGINPNAVSSTEEFLLPSVAPKGVSEAQVMTTRVALNDVQNDAPSSSPALPSNKSSTQRSIHPASMPHPSQISTQEATQAYMGQSSMILGEEIETPRGTEKITIKDSSSIRMSMSQIPAHRASQSQANHDLELDDFDHYDEYDLDPPSSESQPPATVLRRARSPTKAAEPFVNTPTLHKSATRPLQYEAEDEQDNEEAAQEEDPEPSPSRIQATRTPKAAETPSTPSSSPSQPLYSPLKGRYSPIPGFNNETQSNFTQHGHVTAAYVHRKREKGELPKWYVPKPYQVPGYTRR